MAPAKKAAAKAAPVKTNATDEEHVETTNGAAAAPAPVKAVAKTAKKASTPASEAAAGGHVKGVSKDGVAYTKDFDVKFLTAQKTLLLEEKASLTGQAIRLEDEANSLIEESEMGDVQFDDEGGEGDTMVVERERDLFLSARARQDIEEIDAALARLSVGSYGYSVVSFRPIPRERLEAIPWATELTEEKVGGIGRR
jgi:RNA polymerase-binding transcription factor DksA